MGEGAKRVTTLMSDRKLMGRGGLSMPPRAAPSARLAAFWAAALGAQRDRWILWLPVGVMAGAAAYVLAPIDPPRFLGLTLLFAAATPALALAAWPGRKPDSWGARVRAALAGIFALAASAGLGGAAAEWRTARVAAPKIEAPLEGARLEGWVLEREMGARPRLRVLVRALGGVDAPPRIVRVSARDIGDLDAGRAIRCRVSLRAPDGPLAPGAYDFARLAYFQQLGGVGFIWGRCRPALFGPPEAWRDRFALRIGAIRADLSAGIQDAAPGRGGAIAAALIAGDESRIGAEDREALFASGIGHLISVSGLHMAVVGGCSARSRCCSRSSRRSPCVGR